jgi:transcriptional regulator GlxA family with amidase domain
MQQNELIRMTPLGDGPQARAQRRSQEQQLVDQVCAWIDMHLHEDIGWERLVRISGVRPNELQQLFQRHLKTTPMMYIRARLQGAPSRKVA